MAKLWAGRSSGEVSNVPSVNTPPFPKGRFIPLTKLNTDAGFRLRFCLDIHRQKLKTVKTGRQGWMTTMLQQDKMPYYNTGQ